MRKAFFLTSGPPMPIVGARRIRDAQVLSLLSKRMPVEVLCVSEQCHMPSLLKRARDRFGENVSVSCHPLDPPNLFIRALDLVRPHFAQGYSKSIESMLRANAKPGDIIWLSRLRMAKYIGLVRELGCLSVLDEHQIESDLLFDNAFTQLQYWHQGLTAAQCALYEKKLSFAADLVVTASRIDAFRMRKLSPKSKTLTLPHAIDTKIYAPLKNGAINGREFSDIRLAFIGDLDYLPNSHALQWIRTELFPRFTAAFQNQKVRIQIHSQTNEDGRLARSFPEFEFYSYNETEDLVEHLRASTAAIFPIRYGRGNRIHILEALASGIPVITTGRGADGLVLRPLDDICIAEDADDFTSLVMRICGDPNFRDQVADRGLKAVQQRYDWDHSSTALDAILEKLGIKAEEKIGN